MAVRDSRGTRRPGIPVKPVPLSQATEQDFASGRPVVFDSMRAEGKAQPQGQPSPVKPEH